MVASSCIPRTHEVEAAGLPEGWGQSEWWSKILSQKEKIKTKQKVLVVIDHQICDHELGCEGICKVFFWISSDLLLVFKDVLV